MTMTSGSDGARRRLPHAAFAALLTCTALVLPSLAVAQTAESDEATVLEPIVVEGQGVDDDANSIVANRASTGGKTDTDILDSAASVSVITEKEIEMRGAQNLEQVLGYTSGVMVNEWGGDDRYDAFRIRGFDQLSTGTYRDGLPVRGFNWTFGRREPYGFERVEVLKGSNSSLFGLAAPGGIVNAVTKKPKDEAFGEVYTTLGYDPEHVEVGTDFGGPIVQSGEWSYRLTAKWQDSAYSYDYSTDDRIFLAGALTWRPSEATEFTLLVDYNKRDGVPGTGFPQDSGLDIDTFLGEPDFNRFDTVETNIGYQFSHAFGGGFTFRSNARYTTLELDYEQVYGATANPADNRSTFFVDSDSQQFAIDNQLQYDFSAGDFDSKTLLGLEYTWLTGDELALAGEASGIDIYNIAYCGRSCATAALGDWVDWTPELTTKSVYLQEELTYDDRWIFTVGGRFDHVDGKDEDHMTGTTEERSFDNFSKRFGLTYKITPGLAVYGNYSESFEPQIADLSADPMEGEQYELGVKFRPEGMNALFSVAVFNLTQTNVRKQISDSPATFAQIGEINVKGVELEAKAALTDRLNVTAAYSFWDAEITEDGSEGNKGNRPSRVPKHLASIWADYTIPGDDMFGDLTIGAGVRYVGETYGDDANTTKVDAYALVDAGLTYEIADGVSLGVNAINLLDTDYMTTNYSGSEYYGEGRTVTATLKYSW